MIINKIKSIIIFGGGTSGWLTAAYLVKNLKIPATITLIEDSQAGPIGVGEGTQPLTAQFLFQCGITPKTWMKPSNASFKYGVELVGWNDEPYFVDNDSSENCIIAQDLFTNDYFIGKPYSELAKWHPAYRLAKNNISPKYFEHLDVNFGMGEDGFGAVHFSAYDIIKTIKDLIIDKITYVDTKIVEVKQDQYGISKLIDEKTNSYNADLYLDCSGFSSVLLEKTLKSKFTPYNEWLLCDSAVAIPTEYSDPQRECSPYTSATTMDAGWRWTIPTFSRIGNGYVYSSKFITAEEAEQELRQKLDNFSAPAKHLKMKCGIHNEIAVKNVCGVGLSAGFIEPLEATGITFTTATVKSITDLLNMNNNVWNDYARQNLNRGFYEMGMEILTFVWAHYHFSSRNDTDFWQSIRQQKLEKMPKDVQYILSFYLPRPQKFLFFSPSSMFNSFQWFSMLHAGGAYNKEKNQLTKEEQSYCDYFIKTQNDRISYIMDTFPRHYEYLNKWYK